VETKCTIKALAARDDQYERQKSNAKIVGQLRDDKNSSHGFVSKLNEVASYHAGLFWQARWADWRGRSLA
jgi:hypothetical protein